MQQCRSAEQLGQASRRLTLLPDASDTTSPHLKQEKTADATPRFYHRHAVSLARSHNPEQGRQSSARRPLHRLPKRVPKPDAEIRHQWRYNSPVRLIVGISGATGAIYGVRLLEVLRNERGVETHLVISRAAERTIAWETSYTVERLRALADRWYPVQDIAAELSSGSFQTGGMVIAPCSVKTLASVATGVCDNLLARAADVTLKERRRLVLLVREAPLTLAHIRNLEIVTQMGAIVAPPVPAFYNHPQSVDDIVNHTVGRVLDLFGLDVGIVKRWEGMRQPTAP